MKIITKICGVLAAGLTAGLLAGCGGAAGGDFDKKLREMERLCMEERYEEAVAFADEYWFSHPCPISDLVNGQNTLYEGLSEDEIRFRLRLAAYTKTALIGSGSLVSRFFSYYRTPEIYNLMEEGLQGKYSLAWMLRQRVLDNPTIVYYSGINRIEKIGLSDEALALTVPAMLACEQYNLAERYIRVWAGLKGCKKEALKYGEVLAFLRDSSACPPSDDVVALAKKITDYGKKGLTDYINDPQSFEEELHMRWEQNHNSFNVLSCIILDDLLYKRLENIAAMLPDYLRLSGQTSSSDETSTYKIPQPLQEAFWIMRTEEIPIADSIQAYLVRIEWDKTTFQNFERFLQARTQWQYQFKTPEELTKEFGYTFAYNYYFSRFITPPQKPSQNSLMH